MTEETQDAPVEQEVQEAPVVENVESSPTEAVEAVEIEQEAPAPTVDQDAVQARINKITAEKYEAKRQAEELQRRLQEIEANRPPPEPVHLPTLADFDYDETAYQSAMVRYNEQMVNKTFDARLQQMELQRQQEMSQAELRSLETKFATKAQEIAQSNPDFHATIVNIPTLPDDTYKAVMESDKSAEVAYYLGKHLDVADDLSRMSPVQAGRELARLEGMFSAQPKTVSSAPKPAPSVGGGAGTQGFDPSDTSIPIDQWVKQMDALAKSRV